MSWYNNLKGDAFWGIAKAYAVKKYGANTTIDVVISTKRNKKAVHGDPDYNAKYTLFVLRGDDTIAKSKEIPGDHKDRWSPEELVEFLTSLDYV